MKILLVAKSDDFSQALASRLEAEGANVVNAPSGGEGLAAAARTSFDLILLDLELPDMDGLTALRQLHSIGAVARPVFLLKGEGEPSHILQRGLDFGASGYVIKHRLPRDLTTARILASLSNGIGGRQDSCPFSARHEFSRCTVFMPLSITVAEDDIEPSVTCSHLRIGTSDTWRMYPRCAIGDQKARDRYLEERTPV